jgi:hypothetical protein
VLKARKPIDKRKVIEATIRQFAVLEGRAMVRVRSLKTHELATIGVCPACFNLKKRREVLLLKLAKLGYEVAFRQDRLDGVYRASKAHAPQCPYRLLPINGWSQFASVLKRIKKK